jgi:hypothetical protein
MTTAFPSGFPEKLPLGNTRAAARVERSEMA